MPARTVIPPEVRDGDTTVEVGERLNLSSSTIYDLINNGTLRATQVRVGSTWRLNRESVDAAGRTHGARAEEWPKRRGVVTEWLGNGPLERCLRGASGEGDLTDLEHCFGSVAGCDCAECRQEREHEARRGGDARVIPEASVATTPEAAMTAFADDDEAYADYLRATGRNPADSPSFAGREPPPPSWEVRWDDLVMWGRSLGYEVELEREDDGDDVRDGGDEAYRAFS